MDEEVVLRDEDEVPTLLEPFAVVAEVPFVEVPLDEFAFEVPADVVVVAVPLDGEGVDAMSLEPVAVTPVVEAFDEVAPDVPLDVMADVATPLVCMVVDDELLLLDVGAMLADEEDEEEDGVGAQRLMPPMQTSPSLQVPFG